MTIDTGKDGPHANLTPILVAGGEFPREKVRREFVARTISLSEEIRELVLARLDEYESRRRA